MGVVLGMAFAVLYGALVIGAAGMGHGTYIFFASISPACWGLLVYPVAGYFAGDLRTRSSRIGFTVTMVLHYLLMIGNLIAWWADEKHFYVAKMWSHSPMSIIIPAVVYLSGQCFIWGWFFAHRQPVAAAHQLQHPEPESLNDLKPE